MKAIGSLVTTAIVVAVATLAHRAANDYYDNWRAKRAAAKA